MTDWYAEAARLKLAACFPILIKRDAAGRWTKRPLMKGNFQTIDSTPPPDFWGWRKANGLGILMGRGLYALDVDSHKPGAEVAARAWFDEQGLEGQTRVHRTVSGGWHFIYRVPAKWGDLRNRANIVPGLDGRGTGGWIAFGEGYKLARDHSLQLLTESACRAIQGQQISQSGGVLVKDSELADYRLPEDQNALMARLLHLTETNHRIGLRWRNDRRGIEDGSNSAMDMSLAWSLAAHGMTEPEIVFVICELFQHGQCQGKYAGQPDAALRAARRCAARATKLIGEARTPPQFEDTEDTEDVQAAMAEILKTRESGHHDR